MSALIILAILVIGIALVLILTDLVTVPSKVRANVSKIATVLFLALITWIFVVIAMNS